MWRMWRRTTSPAPQRCGALRRTWRRQLAPPQVSTTTGRADFKQPDAALSSFRQLLALLTRGELLPP
eukprot:14475772-Alexandrium_andersonii.AAC.1